MSSLVKPVKLNKYAKDHFFFNRWMLRCAGLWAPDKPHIIIYYLYRMYAIFIFLFVNLFFTVTEFASLLQTYRNLNDAIKNINFALTHLMGAFKVTFWYYRGENLINIINTLEDVKLHYEVKNEFTPGLISKKTKRTGIKYTLCFFMLAHLTLSSSYVPPLLVTIRNPIYIEDENGTLTFHQKLPYFSWMPFKIDSPSKYLIALGYQAIPMFSYAYSIVGMDTLFMNIMNLIGGQMIILKGAFKSIRGRSLDKISGTELTGDKLHNSPELNKQMAAEMNKCVKHLQTVFSVCKELENIHKYLTLSQVMATLFIMCTCLFLVSTTPIASKQFIAEIIYMIAMGFQLILYCWFGNNVTLTASEIPDSIWEGDWLESTYEYRTSMMITMTRMRRPLYLTVGKFAPLTLTTFVSILKASYSFFAVLKQVND